MGQKAKEAEEERAKVKKERLKAMKDCLEDQIHLKDLRVRKEHAEMALQGKIWKEEADEANRKEAADAVHRRQMRQNLDRDLMKQLNTDGIDGSSGSGRIFASVSGSSTRTSSGRC